jgi:hypothetical protein
MTTSTAQREFVAGVIATAALALRAEDRRCTLLRGATDPTRSPAVGSSASAAEVWKQAFPITGTGAQARAIRLTSTSRS